MSDIILKAENISKQYRLGLVGTGTISHDLNRWWSRVRGKEDPYLKVGESNDRSTKGESDYVWALKDINFEVKRGEVLGIIGKNGAGKSTLLKILSRVTTPTTGEIKTKGRIASLLEVGTGFHPEMTGRENIFLNGAILGMTKNEIASKLDEIIDFSGCARYIDTPVKRYSSGMRVRLAFAVAAHLEPDILVVDEVLAVGDAEFQKKAIGKMQDISKGDGRTVLFVSHNMAAVQNLCSRVVVINNGEIVFSGATSTGIDYYLKNSSFGYKDENSVVFPRTKNLVEIREINIESRHKSLPNKLNTSSSILMGSDIDVNILVNSNEALGDIKVSAIISNTDGQKIMALRSYEMNKVNFNSESDFLISIKLKDLKLMPSEYFLTIGLAEGNTTVAVKNECLSFTIVSYDVFNTGKIPKGKYLIYSEANWDLKNI